MARRAPFGLATSADHSGPATSDVGSYLLGVGHGRHGPRRHEGRSLDPADASGRKGVE